MGVLLARGAIVFPHPVAVQECIIVAVVLRVCKSPVDHIFKACFIFEFFDGKMVQSVTVVVYDYLC